MQVQLNYCHRVTMRLALPADQIEGIRKSSDDDAKNRIKAKAKGAQLKNASSIEVLSDRNAPLPRVNSVQEMKAQIMQIKMIPNKR